MKIAENEFLKMNGNLQNVNTHAYGLYLLGYLGDSGCGGFYAGSRAYPIRSRKKLVRFSALNDWYRRWPRL